MVSPDLSMAIESQPSTDIREFVSDLIMDKG